jgi:hypothetical protein
VPAAGTPPPARRAAAAARRIELPQHLFPTYHPRRCLLSRVAFLRPGLFLFFSSPRFPWLLRYCSDHYMASPPAMTARRFRARRQRVGRGGGGEEGRNGNNGCLVFLLFGRIEEFCPGPEMRCFRTARAD